MGRLELRHIGRAPEDIRLIWPEKEKITMSLVISDFYGLSYWSNKAIKKIIIPDDLMRWK